jgi:hypothetical protein
MKAAIVRFVACCCILSCQATAEHAPKKEIAVTPRAIPQDPFEGVFPPAWKAGDKWRVSMKTQFGDPNVAMPNYRRPFGDLVFEFQVLSVPQEDDGVYLVDIQSKNPTHHYVAQYRKNPFSFVRLDDQLNPDFTRFTESNSCLPHVGLLDRIIQDFPAMPQVPRLGVTPFLRLGRIPAAQEIEATGEGLRFTITAPNFQSVMTWKRGAPWWSTVERGGMSPLGSQEFLGSGELLKR